jgi:hypothetical protein
VNDFKIKLQTKLNAFQTAQQNTDFKSPTYSTLFHSIGNYVSDLVDYNKAVALYLNPSNTSTTRMTILEQLKGTYPNLPEAFRTLPSHLEQLHRQHQQTQEEVIRMYFAKVMVIYSLYDIINAQFRQNTYSVIAENDLLKHIPYLPDRFTDISESTTI